MKVTFTIEKTGWPVQKVMDLKEAATLSEVIKQLVAEGVLPDLGEEIYLLHHGASDEEMAVYYPCVKKVVQLDEEKRTLRHWFKAGEGTVRIQVYEGWAERLAKLDPDGLEEQPEAAEDKEGEGKQAAWGPREKELTLLKLMKGLGKENEAAYAKSAGWQLWLYLLGFVLVMAYLVSCLTAFISGGAAEGGKTLYEVIGNRALYFLIPSALCFVVGKVAEIVSLKKKAKKEPKETDETKKENE